MDYYYPYYLHFINAWSFTYYNSVVPEPIVNKSVDLWSITRVIKGNYNKYSYKKKYTASYHYHTQNYEFAGNIYVNYEDVIKAALTL